MKKLAKLNKRFLGIILAIALFVGSMPTSVFADIEQQHNEYVEHVESGKEKMKDASFDMSENTLKKAVEENKEEESSDTIEDDSRKNLIEPTEKNANGEKSAAQSEDEKQSAEDSVIDEVSGTDENTLIGEDVVVDEKTSDVLLEEDVIIEEDADNKEEVVIAESENETEDVTEEPTDLVGGVAHVHCDCGCDASCGDGHNDDQNWTAWTSTNSMPTTEGYYFLTEDVTLSPTGNDAWIISDGGSYHICLNGHVIKNVGNNKRLIYIQEGSSLTITDCKDTEHYFKYSTDSEWTYYGDEEPNGIVADSVDDITEATEYVKVTGGCITGGNRDNTGSGILNEGELSIYNTNLVGNKGTSGAGFSNRKTAILQDTTIIGNYATTDGGGVNIDYQSIATMTNCTIKNNKSTRIGGGLCVFDGTVCLIGGCITDNISFGDGGGLYAYNGTVYMSGSITIKDNKSGDTDQNLYINNEKHYDWSICKDVYSNISIESLASDSEIFVTMFSTPKATKSVIISPANEIDYSDCFFSDNIAYEVRDYKNSDGHTLKLSTIPVVCEISSPSTSDFYGNKYSSIQEALNEDGISSVTIKMLSDATESIGNLSDSNITLDLNGHILKADGEIVVKIAGGTTFNIIDSSPSTIHYFRYSTDSEWTYYGDDRPEGIVADTLDDIATETEYVKVCGGCITGSHSGGIRNNGEFNLEGGNIIGNSADYGGGIYNTGLVNMKESSLIIGNHAVEYGGGVHNYTWSSFTMNDCSRIAYNNCENDGGGVYNTKSILMNGSSSVANNISGNDGGGVYNAYRCTLKINGG